MLMDTKLVGRKPGTGYLAIATCIYTCTYMYLLYLLTNIKVVVDHLLNLK